MKVKNIISIKKIIVGIQCICENSKYLKSVVDTSMTKSDEIVIVLNNWSTKKANTITADITSTALINWYAKKSKRLLYFTCRFIAYDYIIHSC